MVSNSSSNNATIATVAITTTVVVAAALITSSNAITATNIHGKFLEHRFESFFVTFVACVAILLLINIILFSLHTFFSIFRSHKMFMYLVPAEHVLHDTRVKRITPSSTGHKQHHQQQQQQQQQQQSTTTSGTGTTPATTSSSSSTQQAAPEPGMIPFYPFPRVSARVCWKRRRYLWGVVGLHQEIEDFIKFMEPTQVEQAMRDDVLHRIKKIITDLWVRT